MWQLFWNLFNVSDLKCHNKLRYDAVDIHTREISIITVTMLIYYIYIYIYFSKVLNWRDSIEYCSYKFQR